MKKLTTLFTFALFSFAISAQAATINLSPTTVTVAPGQTVAITVTIDPASSTISTVETQISYPSNLLTPTSFTFGPSWVALTKSGYDQMSNGTVIKTGGYPNGFTVPTLMGTLTFTAQKAGIANIGVQNTSLVYATNNQNMLTGVQGTSHVTISGGTVASTSPTQSNHITSAATTRTAATSITTTAARTTTATSGTATALTNSQAAAVAAAGVGKFSIPTWIWIVLAIAIVASGGWWVYQKFGKHSA